MSRRDSHMTRYVILCNGLFVAAVQPDTKHVSLTDKIEDAGEWATYERTVQAARLAQQLTGEVAFISHVKVDPRPSSWDRVAK